MGLILPQTVKVRTNAITCKHYREKGYEFEKCGDFIEVDVLDLLKSSNEKVKVICDVCGKEREMRYCRVIGNNEENKPITCGSNSCKRKKTEDTCMKKYGVNNPMQCKKIQDKAKDTNLKRYGAESPFGSKEIQDKAKDTNLGRYGVENPMQCKEIQDKAKDTNLERYGAENPMQCKEIKDKIKATLKEKHGEGITCSFQLESVKEKLKQTWQKNYGEGIINPGQAQDIKDKIRATWLKNYGVDHPFKSEEIKNKVLNSFQFNHTGPSSRAQRYINYILNGTLNKHICGSLADIYIEKENIIIEHDGRGHFLGDIINGNAFPTKESLLREKQREDKIINNGYKMIRFIATKDRIPSDEVILNLIEEFKNSDFKVVRINFEEGTIDRDYEEKWYCNFGKLRRITKEDLE